MFTGMIESLGMILRSQADEDGVGRWLEISAAWAHELALGESVAVNGVCLTVVKTEATQFAVQASPTTLAITTLGELKAGQQVNLERSVTPAARLGGHWVLGHVDAKGTVTRIEAEGESHHITVSYPPRCARWVLPQGSITMDGISLTVVDAPTKNHQLSVTIIPHTFSHSTVAEWRSGTVINLEFDALGKYVDRLMQPYQASPGGVKA